MITPAKWHVCRIVWANPEMTSREIIDALQEITPWKEGTIKTLIHRLHQKNILHIVPDSLPYRWISQLSEADALNQQPQEVFDQTFYRNHGSSLGRLIDGNALSVADCQRLIQLLEKKQKTAPDTLACHCPPYQCHC